jgi:ATP-dependent Clp protease ATP-binding subunit ClpX
MTANIKLLHSCSFCGKSQTQVKTLIAGSGAYICDECVNLCVDVIRPKESPSITADVSQLMPPQIVEHLDSYVIGQTLAKKTLAVAIYNHLRRVRQPEIDGVQIDKSNILMIGSSGSGKTLMVSTLSKILKVPFATVDATSLSQTGYVGLDPEECLTRLYQAADNDLSRAEQGIVFIDEVDKIGRKSGENVSTTRDVSGEGVQQALLKIIEGNDVKFTPAGGRKNPNGEFLTMNTRNILFILGGAFEGLASHIAARTAEKNSSMGFLGTVMDPDKHINMFEMVQKVTVEDLISFGMIPELVGRIPVVVPFEDLDQTTLVRILTEPRNAIVRQFTKIFESQGIKLTVESAALEAIAAQVISSKTGARGLRRIMEQLLLDTQYHMQELIQSGVKEVKITQQTVINQEPPQTLLDAAV